MKRRLLSTMLTILITLSLIMAPATAIENPFSDVQPTDWYYDSVLYVYDNGLFSGVSADQFSPSTNMTRAMFVSVLFRQASKLGYDTSAAKSNFSDLTKEWYQEAIDWASANGVVNGVTETAFQPDREITREQMCAILIRYLKDYLQYDLSAYSGTTDFSDHGKIANYAIDSVSTAQKMGLISGKSVNSTFIFGPQAGATRAAVAKVMTLESKLLDSLSKIDGSTASGEAVAGNSGGAAGGGSGTGSATHTQEEIAEEAQMAEYLAAMVSNYNKMDYINTVDAQVKTCMDVLMDTLTDALAAHDDEIFLDRSYVSEQYSSQIAEFKNEYEALTSDQENQLRQVVIRLGTTYEIQGVMNYFGVSSGYFS